MRSKDESLGNEGKCWNFTTKNTVDLVAIHRILVKCVVKVSVRTDSKADITQAPQAHFSLYGFKFLLMYNG